MTTTPISKSRLACKRDKLESTKEAEPTTPSNKNRQAEQDDYSPVFFQFTQESNEEIDVMWDWHSPQSSQRRKRKQKRLLPVVQSPNIPIRRFPSNNQSQEFERLKQELKLLQEELAVPDDESFLCVSPQQENEIKLDESKHNLELENQLPTCEEFDAFDDSMDEQLVLFSQKIEEELINEEKNKEENEFSDDIDDTEINKLLDKYRDKPDVSKEDNEKKPSNLLKRTFSEDTNSRTSNYIQTSSGRMEFHRTKSFELATLTASLTQNEIDEIEKKRLEAKAKLELKIKKDDRNLANSCSPEEIEKKRKQALAKLEARKLQELVEKKRQEAVKKLQISRMKNASQVKSTLAQRL